jgi:3-hydroxyisobutyrate dehydrogenase-like beta-hydroxyacid dehydrogenase
MARIGFLGLGEMGTPMASRLLRVLAQYGMQAAPDPEPR